jgi:hypothetical protein
VGEVRELEHIQIQFLLVGAKQASSASPLGPFWGLPFIRYQQGKAGEAFALPLRPKNQKNVATISTL